MVDGGRNNVVNNGHQRCNRFHGSGCSQQVACHRFGGVDVDFIRIISKQTDNGFGFGNIACRGGSAMGIDVVNILDCYPGIGQCSAHGQDGAQSFGMRGSDVVGISR